MENNNVMLSVEHLTKVFEETRAVDDLNFELERGEICGFVGPNGAGKTTTMRIIATLEEPTYGDVMIDGMSIFEEPYKIRRCIGFMPDHYGSYPALTVSDYLEFYARAYEVDSSIRDQRIRSIMDFTGLDVLKEKRVQTLSKGMKQRLNLGRALINDPKIMVMDEPAAGLDPRARVELRTLIKTLAEEQQKTIFVSSHILTELSEFCDHLLIIDKGKCITFGNFSEIQQGLSDTLTVSLKLLTNEKINTLVEFLQNKEHVENIKTIENGALHFDFLGEEKAIPLLMREILNAEFPLLEFKPHAMSMEDVFIEITEGN